MKHRYGLRLIGFLLAFTLVAGNCSQTVVYADEKRISQDESVKELTDLEITDLSEPEAGKPLDTKATVVSAEGVRWEIPVIWIGEDQKAATVAEPGRKYMPTFVFYVPKGYKVKGASAGGNYTIRLPQFIEKYGLTKLVYAADPSNGIVYITWNPAEFFGYFPGYWQDGGNKAAEDSEDPGPHNKKDADGSGEDEVGDDEAGEDEAGDEETPYWEVDIHCTRNLIEHVGYEALSQLVDLLKNEIEPRAIAALLDAFPAFTEAVGRGQIGSGIGMYILSSDFDPVNADFRNVPEGTDAAVMGGYEDNDFVQLLIVNSKNILKADTSGEYVLNETGLTEAKNIIIHELMHAVMNDYTRTGSASIDTAYFLQNAPVDTEFNSFPKWFKEGTASTVHHVYRYQRGGFWILAGMPAVSSLGTVDLHYSIASVQHAFHDTDPQNTCDIKKYRSDYNDDVGGAYVGGYLAVVYLSTLIQTGATGANPLTDLPAGFDSEMVRSGFNTILYRLHNGTPLDTIIRDTGLYSGIVDFEEKFANYTGTDGEGNHINDPSLDFTVSFLNYLEDITRTNGTIANGSLLLPFDTLYGDPLVGRNETSEGQTVLKIMDTNDLFVSDADDDAATGSAGSYHAWEQTDDIMRQYPAVAALTPTDGPVAEPVTEPAIDEASTEEPADEPATEEPSDEPATEEPADGSVPEPAEEEPAAEPVEEPVTEDTGAEDTGSEDTGSEDTGSEDTGSEDDGSGDESEPESE